MFLAFSGIAHVVAAAAFLIVGMWRIEKLPSERVALTNLVSFVPPGDSGGGAAPAAQTVTPPKIKPRKITKDVVQPEVTKSVDPALSLNSTDPATGNGNGTGGDGKGHEVPTGDGCLAPPCGVGPAVLPMEPIVVAPVVVPEVKIVPPSVVAGLRLSGETQIAPSDVVSTAIARDGHDKVVSTFKMCLSADGAVSSVTRIKSSGYPEYDSSIMQTMRTWKYRPYKIGDSSVGVCSVVTFAYSAK
jgi:TonB family protein